MNLINTGRCALIAALIGLGSCGTPKNVVMFQDTPDKELFNIARQEEIRLRPGDKISILVNSRDNANVNMLNLPYVSRNIGTAYSGNYQGIAGYTIDREGYINFPVLGKLHVGGLTRIEVAQMIERELQTRGVVNDAVVTVDYQNLSVSVLGEVQKPGPMVIDRDKVTVLDALSAAGDMTINGRRDNVTVTRQEGDKQHTYVIDLTSAESTYSSPAFYLQQNDVIYVEPNQAKIRQSTVNGNNLVSASFWLSLTSVLATVGVLIFK